MANPFRVLHSDFYIDPELSLRSNSGLKLANAFGVMSEQQLQSKLNVARVAC